MLKRLVAISAMLAFPLTIAADSFQASSFDGTTSFDGSTSFDFGAGDPGGSSSQKLGDGRLKSDLEIIVK